MYRYTHHLYIIYLNDIPQLTSQRHPGPRSAGWDAHIFQGKVVLEASWPGMPRGMAMA